MEQNLPLLGAGSEHDLSKSTTGYANQRFASVAPSPPVIEPADMLFNDSDLMAIACSSFNGRPTAKVQLLIVRNPSHGSYNVSAVNETTAMITVDASKEWSNAIVTCTVLNHKLPGMNTSRLIQVNYIIASDTNNTQNVVNGWDNLDCGQYVDSFPQAVFMWSPFGVAGGGNYTNISNPPLPAVEINCTAINPVINRNVTVRFIVKSVTTTVRLTDHTTVLSPGTIWIAISETTSIRDHRDKSTTDFFIGNNSAISDATASSHNFTTHDIIIVCAVMSSAVTVAVTVTITLLCRKRYYLKRQPVDGIQVSDIRPQGNSGNTVHSKAEGKDIYMKENFVYGSTELVDSAVSSEEQSLERSCGPNKSHSSGSIECQNWDQLSSGGSPSHCDVYYSLPDAVVPSKDFENNGPRVDSERPIHDMHVSEIRPKSNMSEAQSEEQDMLSGEAEMKENSIYESREMLDFVGASIAP